MRFKSLADNNSYRLLKLKNEIEVLLVHNEEFTNSSCSVAVNVGSFDEPMEFPGIAHFLEHMLFMGTTKFPNENDFENFIGLHNGSSNAYTMDDKTVYFCNVDSAAFGHMVDMFANFFIGPLLSADSVNREISAVNSEYLNTLNIHYWRIEGLLSEFSKKDQSKGRFCCGNAETLRKEGILEEVRKFWENNYSSDLMKVVICSNLSFEELERLAMFFEEIKNYNKRKEKKNSFGNFLNTFFEESVKNEKKNGGIEGVNLKSIELFKKDCFKKMVLKNSKLYTDDFCYFDKKFHNKIVKMKPLNNLNDLNICVNLPSVLHLYKYKVLEYIMYELENERETSLLSKYKDKNLAFGINATFTDLVEFTKVAISINLTEKGAKEYLKVLNMLCDWLDDFYSDEAEWRWLKRIEEEEFTYKSNESPDDLARELSEKMLKYPIDCLLNNEYIYEIYDEDVINTYIRKLGDYKRWIIVFGNKEGVFNSTEKYYNVEYSIIGNYERERCCKFKNKSKRKQMFVSSFECVKGEKSRVEYSENVMSVFVFNEKFLLPRTKIYFVLNPVDFCENFVKYDLYCKLALDCFTEKYADELKSYNLDVSISPEINGIVMVVEGISDKIVEISKLLLASVNNINTKRFLLCKKLVEDNYVEKMYNPPFRRLRDVFNSSMKGFKSIETCHDEIRKLTLEDIKTPDNCTVKMLVIGNIKHEKSKELVEFIASKKMAAPESQGEKTSVIFTNNGRISKNLQFRFKTGDEFNNSIGMYYPFSSFDNYKKEDSDSLLSTASVTSEKYPGELKLEDTACVLKDYAVGMLFHQIASDTFFNQLRTKEELGYCVASSIRAVGKTHFIGFEVQSTKPVDFLENRIKKFIEDLVNLKEIDDLMFETHKESLVSYYKDPILNLDDLASLIYSDVMSRSFDLLFRKKIIKVIKTLKKEDLFQNSIFNNYVKISSFKN